jgi:adenosylhomocysteine nucleosidase
MTVVTFAMSGESREFRRRVRNRPDLVVMHCGVGLEMAARSAEMFLKEYQPKAVVCAGYAGGLCPELPRGGLVVATEGSSPNWVDRARQVAARRRLGEAEVRFGRVASERRVVESVGEKQRLYRETGALAVDMETEALREACLAAGVEFLAVRVVSDPAWEPMPVPMEAWFDLVRQRARPFRLLRYLMANPGAAVPFVRFACGLKGVGAGLASFLVELVDERGVGEAGGTKKV